MDSKQGRLKESWVAQGNELEILLCYWSPIKVIIPSCIIALIILKVYTVEIVRTYLVSLLSSPNLAILLLSKQPIPSDIGLQAFETGKVVPIWSHSRVADSLNHAASTVPSLSLSVYPISEQNCEPREHRKSYCTMHSTRHRADLSRRTTNIDWIQLLSSM